MPYRTYHSAEQASQYTVLTIRINEMRILIAVFLALSTLLLACERPKEALVFSTTFIQVPTQGASTGPRLATGASGALLLSWMEPADRGTALRFAHYHDGGWSAAITVTDEVAMFVNWADLPSVVPVRSDLLAAHWLQRSAAHSHAYNIAYAESSNGGVTWTKALTPHRDGTDTEHGFVSMYTAGRSTGLLWLDGRKMINDITDDPTASGMTLRAASVSNGEIIDNEQLVDELVCDCCQTDVAISSHGAIAVYRDRTADEIRDIAITRWLDGEWHRGRRIASDNWEIDGCPVNGPAISATGNRVAVAWFTAATGPLVRLSISDDGGEHFNAPIDVVRSNTLGRVDVVLLDDGGAAVSWLQSDDARTLLNVRRISADGALGPVRTVADALSQLSVPQMAKFGHDLVFAWTESRGSKNRVISARVDARSL